MQRYVFGVVILIVLGLALFLTTTHRTWGLILFLLALIFYGLFAHPRNEEKASSREKPRRKPKRKKK